MNLQGEVGCEIATLAEALCLMRESWTFIHILSVLPTSRTVSITEKMYAQLSPIVSQHAGRIHHTLNRPPTTRL